MKKFSLMVSMSLISMLIVKPVSAGPFSFLNPSNWFNSSNPAYTSSVEQEAAILSDKIQAVSPDALKLALTAYEKARAEGLVQKPVLTVIDYSKPSTEPRLVVIDLQHNQPLYQVLVAHGKNSGGNVPTFFSNQPRSLASSLGVFVTGETYIGKHGLSLRLNGLERGINDNALNRDIVFHGADYVNDSAASHLGRIGRSWGCPAVSMAVINPIISHIKSGSLVFAYYPDQRWLHRSQFLQA